MSKETQNKDSAKTESALNSYIWLVVAVVVLVVGVKGWKAISCKNDSPKGCDVSVEDVSTAPVQIIDLIPGRGAYFKPEYATTEKERVKGLSGRSSIAKNQVLIFDFETEQYPGIWMKDMKFPIDIVWTDAGKKVVYIQKQVSPDTYPTVFQPTSKARYVLELASGRVDELSIKEGTQLKF